MAFLSGGHSSYRLTRQIASKHGRFLTGMKGTFQTASHLFFVMDLVTGGDLMFHLLKASSFTEDEVRFYTAEVALGYVVGVCAPWILSSSPLDYRQEFTFGQGDSCWHRTFSLDGALVSPVCCWLKSPACVGSNSMPIWCALPYRCHHEFHHITEG
jgi:hypothetical protein